MSSDFEVFVTADEAWPAFERAALAARRSITAGFRLFDMRTRLRSPEAGAIGETWLDLLEHVLRKGVRLTIVVSDFDPVMATDLHEAAWMTVRQGATLGELAGAGPDQLQVRAHQHPARAGLVPWLTFLPIVASRKRHRLQALSQDRIDRQAIGLRSSWLPEMHPATHHQKLAVFDDDVLYVGGLDLNERRYDTPEHDRPAEQTWSDVQVIVRGPEAKAAKIHLETFEAVTAGHATPPDCPGLLRTLSTPRRLQFPYLSPRTVLNEVERAHLDAFKAARHLVYIETQFFRSGVLAEGLAEAAARNPDLTAVIVLPGLPDDVAYEGHRGIDARYGLSRRQDALETLTESFSERLTLAVPVQPRLAARETKATLAGSPLIHVHNKVLVRDDDYALIGSANLNGRSMKWDTEVALEITQAERVSQARERLMRHWWHRPLPPEAQQPETLRGWWHKEIQRNGVVLPENRSGLLVPFDAGSGAELAQPLPGVTENMV